MTEAMQAWFFSGVIVLAFIVMFLAALLAAEWCIVIITRIYNRFKGSEKRTQLPPYITKE